MRPLTFGKAMRVFRDKGDDSRATARPLKASSGAKSSVRMQHFIALPLRSPRPRASGLGLRALANNPNRRSARGAMNRSGAHLSQDHLRMPAVALATQ